VKILAIVAIVTLGLASNFLVTTVARRRRLKHLRGREELSAEDIFARYYAGRSQSQKEAFARYWQECARQLRLPAQLLRPGDRFDRELGSLRALDPFSDRKEDLAQYALDEARRRNRSWDLGRVETFGDLVEGLARLDVPE
jgi:hypothetical protein